MDKKFYTDLYESITNERTSYRAMIGFCCDSLILNNEIEPTLSSKDIWFDDYCGNSYDEEADEYIDIYQQYIISSNDAERLARYTNEIVRYNEELDIYLLCVTHFGTMWDGVPENWKTLDDFLESNEY